MDLALDVSLHTTKINTINKPCYKLQVQKLKYTPGPQKMFLKSAFNQRFQINKKDDIFDPSYFECIETLKHTKILEKEEILMQLSVSRNCEF